VKIIGSDGSVINEKAKTDTHDQVMIQGTLVSGAVLAFTIRSGAPFKGAPGLEWNIYGEKGEIRVKGPLAHVQMFGTTSIELFETDRDIVGNIELKKGTFEEMIPTHRNVARLYEAIAAGEKSVLCDFEGAVKRHELIEELYNQN
jgi:predicted dehydrogenase